MLLSRIIDTFHAPNGRSSQTCIEGANSHEKTIGKTGRLGNLKRHKDGLKGVQPNEWGDRLGI